MNNTKESGELFCVLIPLAESKVLLPRSAVEEVRAISAPEPIEGAPEWIVGNVRWNRQAIPLLALEPLLGEEVPKVSRRTRMVVIKVSGAALEPAVIGLMSQGFPYILRVTPELLQIPEPGEAPEVNSPDILVQVRMGLEHPLIPDISELASRVVAAIAESKVVSADEGSLS